MKLTKLFSVSFACLFVFALVSCQNEENVIQNDEISDATMAKISSLGFTSKGAIKADGGYIVEGDIFLSDADLNVKPSGMLLRIADVEQYRTTNLVNAGSGRTITISVDSKMSSDYNAVVDEVCARYNAENLSLNFTRVASGGNIVLYNANGSYLASAGFPTGGNPHNSVKVNSRAIGNVTTSTGLNYAATIIAHEVGHCIGFRHTDYMDRSYSCGGGYSNEGASTVGAIHIPGTPTTADAGSWMLACIGSGRNRPFNANDKTALSYLY
jgi:hypothetical protein